MSTAATWTLGRLLQWTADYLRDHNSESARLDAEVLLAYARDCSRIDLYTRFDEEADESLRDKFRDLVKRRAAGTPVAYLVGHREFYSKSFDVTPAVLIPRPETEFVLIALLDLIKSSAQTTQHLDLIDVGTGSGILAICAALELPNVDVTAIDISEPALAVARSNAEQHDVSERIRFVQSDLFASIADNEQFDYVVANPPYIRLDEKPTLPRDVVDHEPHQALFGGERGLDILGRLIEEAAVRLKPGGWLLSEFNPAQIDDVRRFVQQQSSLESPQFVDDMTRRPRVLTVRRELADSP